MTRYVCIHGHFYQPPRENPWLGTIEYQGGAQPYHDWNELVADQCYRPNTAARILAPDGTVADIVNNFAHIRFSAGPTLLAWLEEQMPDTYAAILSADRGGMEQYSGHGTAIAQAYNHMIMPLAAGRDKRTQVLWGIRDFEARFLRRPEGMWLPELAVDYESLDIMADAGIAFTILEPGQAERVRPIGEDSWEHVEPGTIDTAMPYLCRLPSGRSIAIFFYQARIAQEIAFGDLLENGGRYAERIISAFPEGAGSDRIVSIATDGETYGHHRRFGEMALAYCIRSIESGDSVKMTVYGEYLERHPPTHAVAIREKSSWSCAHGIERWQGNCGCNTGQHPEWSQEWRRPLREAMDYLGEALAQVYEEKMAAFTPDPWRLRDRYIDVVLGVAPDRFLGKWAKEDRVQMLGLLEMQRHAMLMYASCGWFFDDIAEVGSVQVMRTAARAMQLARTASGPDLEPGYLAKLKEGRSNMPGHATGAEVYAAEVQPVVMDLLRIGAHHAVLSAGTTPAHTMTVSASKRRCHEGAFVTIGRAHLVCNRTLEELPFWYGMLESGIGEVTVGVKPCSAETPVLDADDPKATFIRAFEGSLYALSDLLPDERREFLSRSIARRMHDLGAFLRCTFRGYESALPAMQELAITPPGICSDLYRYLLTRDLEQLLLQESIDPEAVLPLARAAADSPVISRAITSLMKQLSAAPDDLSLMSGIESTINRLNGSSIRIDMWESQNIYLMLYRKHHPTMRRCAEDGDQAAAEWISHFERLGITLGVRPAC